jgi:hypothetical protein
MVHLPESDFAVRQSMSDLAIYHLSRMQTNTFQVAGQAGKDNVTGYI